MEQICDENLCTGCSACYNICSKDAITMENNELGFAYPKIDNEKCVDCGLCKKICPALNPVLQKYPDDCYAVAANDDEELLSCASGGAATQISREIIKQNGVVYGCSSENPKEVQHVRIADAAGLEILKGSKYVQSKIGNIFRKVKEDLKSGLKVFFVGTPCQIAGLKKYIGEKLNDNLYTADLVCHGVPSQKMLNDNIHLYETENTLFQIKFRKKAITKQNTVYRILFGWFFQNQPYKDNAPIWVSYDEDPYMNAFIGCLSFRDCCYKCRYANAARCADVTLADFWCLGSDAGFESGKGVSLLMVNNEKGKYLLSLLNSSCRIVQRDITEAIKGNGQLQRPSDLPYQRKMFCDLYVNGDFKTAVKRSMRKQKIKTKLKNFVLSMYKTIRLQ